MAKRGRRILPARKKERDDDSLLIRSAESLGRVIGSLQRQINDRSKRMTAIANDVVDAIPNPPRLKNPFARSVSRNSSSARNSSGARKRSTRKAAAAPKATGSRKRSAGRTSSKKR